MPQCLLAKNAATLHLGATDSNGNPLTGANLTQACWVRRVEEIDEGHCRLKGCPLSAMDLIARIKSGQ